MNFNHLNILPVLVLLFLLIVIIQVSFERKFFKVIKTYWFYNRSLLNKISSWIFLIGIGGLVFSLLDVRGPEEKIKTEVPQDRTIILLDTSASMLAEDVKPSRLQKSVLIAKHFARKAAGHQISLVAFAEIQKKIVPFTNDLDLIDARLDSVKLLRNQYGSSALSMAIQESIQYLRDVGGEARGNILVLTDGEETAEGIKLNVPEGVHVALIGVGTERGGRIPLDDSRGFRFGYKKHQGNDVITKLNESFFQKTSADLPSGKYWLANSYSLPSEEVLDFFTSEKAKGMDLQDMIIKPVLMEWIVIPSLLLIVLAYLLKFTRVFTLGLLLIIPPAFGEKTKEVELSPDVVSRLQSLQDGRLSRNERIKLADDLRSEGAKEESLSLYQENLPLNVDKSLPPEAYLNYGTALLEKGDAQKGLEVYKKLSESLGDGSKEQEIKESISKNIMIFFRVQEKKKQEQKNKDKKNKKDQGKDKNKSGSGSEKGQSGEQGSGTKDKDDSKSDQNEDEDSKDGEDEDKGESDRDEKENKDAKKNQEGADDKPTPPHKIPAKLKQLMSDDRQLQMMMIEGGTKDLNKRKSRKSKDW